MASDPAIVFLRGIRASIGALRQDVNARLDQTNARLDRVEHGLDDLGRFMRQIALDQARHKRFHAHHAEKPEDDVVDL